MSDGADAAAAQLPAWRLLQGYARDEWRAGAVVRAVLHAAHTRGARLGAFAAIFDAHAIADAEAAGRPGRARPLAGMPVSIKDDLFTAGLPTCGGSRAFAGHVPATEGPAVRRLGAAGAVVFGKTNLAELSMTLDSGSPLHGPCRNPWNPAHIAGASSCGAASAVAAGIGPVALATDSGGSIRYPAALCGVIGFSPSSGRVPRYGNFGANHAFCAIGALARTVRDVALVLGAVSGADASDPASWAYPRPIRMPPGQAGRPLRIGLIEETADAAIERRVQDVVRALVAGHGWSARPLRLDTEPAAAAYRTLSDCDRLALMRAAGTLTDATLRAMAPAVQARLQRGRAVSGADYAAALEQRRVFMARLWQLFRQTDLVVAPTVLATAARFDDDVAAAGAAATGRLWWTNFAGAPAATLPIGLAEGLPIALHLAARPGADGLLLGACDAIERLLAPGPLGFPMAPAAG